MPKISRTKQTNPHSTFETSYSLLNPAQKKAVDSIEGPVLVIAGPGTGKTTILTLRIANIILRSDTAPESILALTFTESGALAMRRKLLDIIGPSAYKVNIHTFHGFAGRIIEEYPDYFPRIVGSVIITEAEQIKIIENAIQARNINLLRPYGDPTYYIRPILSEIHLLKRENISPEAFVASVEVAKRTVYNIEKTEQVSRRIPIKSKTKSTKSEGEMSSTDFEKFKKQTEKNSELAYIYEQYESFLAENKYYDFDDMLLELIKSMESNAQFKLILQETYQYIHADEHQDANAAQNRILELLADFHLSPNLFIVGDDKQAIYRFQGASLENFLYFSKKYSDANVIDLEHNYRSHQLILDASHSLILNNPTIEGHERVKLRSLQVGGRPIRVAELSDISDELEHMALSIKKMIEKKEKPEEIAIIYRENKHAPGIAKVLKAHGVPYRVESDHDILNDPDIKKIIIICRAIHDASDSEVLASALWMPELKCDPADVAELCALASREKIPLHKLIKDKTLNKKILEKVSVHGFKQISSAYKQIVDWSQEAKILPLLDLIDKVIQSTSMLSSVVASNQSMERLSSIEAFYDRMSGIASSKKTFLLKDCIEYLDIIGTHGISSKQTQTEHIGGVRLMTAHRSKGLEFNYVFILHAADGIWGNRRKRSLFTLPVIEHARDTGRIEDERRLFYVALTRAREGVNISYARSDGDKDYIPSQFISEIDADLMELESPDIGRRVGNILENLESASDDNARSILNPLFVRSKFLGQPLSVTHLNNYLKCPWRYFFVNLIRVPQAQSKQQMYGTAVHGALRTFFEAYRNERDINVKRLLDVFKRNLERLPLSVNDRADSFEKGKRALTGYIQSYNGTWNRNLVPEFSIRGVHFELDEKTMLVNSSLSKSLMDEGQIERTTKLQLTGNLDKIEFLSPSEVVVTDFKTGKPKSRNDIQGITKTSEGDYMRQLVFYKLLLSLDSKRLHMKYGEIDFIEPNEKGIYKKERFEVTQRDIDELAGVINKMASEVLKLAFTNSKCEDKQCQYCMLGKILTKK